MRGFHNSRGNTHYFEDFILVIGITTHTLVHILIEMTSTSPKEIWKLVLIKMSERGIY